MKSKGLIAVAVAGALASPFAAIAQGTGGTTTAPSAAQPLGNPPAGSPAGAPSGPVAGAGTIRHPDISASFDRIDRNNDGRISRAEWDQFHRASGGGTVPSGDVSGAAGVPQATPDTPSSGAPVTRSNGSRIPR